MDRDELLRNLIAVIEQRPDASTIGLSPADYELLTDPRD